MCTCINLSIQLQSKAFSLKSRQYSTAYLGTEEQWEGKKGTLSQTAMTRLLRCQYLLNIGNISICWILENKSHNTSPADDCGPHSR